MSTVLKVLDTIFNSDGSSATHVGNTTLTSSGNNMADSEATNVGDTFFHNGKTYTRIGGSLFGPDGKVWTSAGDLSDNDVRGIIASDDDKKNMF